MHVEKIKNEFEYMCVVLCNVVLLIFAIGESFTFYKFACRMHGICNLVEAQRTRHLLLQCLCYGAIVRCRNSIDNGGIRHIHCNTMKLKKKK